MYILHLTLKTTKQIIKVFTL